MLNLRIVCVKVAYDAEMRRLLGVYEWRLQQGVLRRLRGHLCVRRGLQEGEHGRRPPTAATILSPPPRTTSDGLWASSDYGMNFKQVK